MKYAAASVGERSNFHEIPQHARLSPIALTQKLTAADARLHRACVLVLTTWTARLRAESVGAFPANVTAFRVGNAVHDRYGHPCPLCQTSDQRIRDASNEVNYCSRRQTGGRLLADGALSRLLRAARPRAIEELE
ncbi:MAG: hypothetical protein EXR87_07110 [Gammaproteobacteria bacterium]|nr:hypothetical protein [Gammaproteobacteria bacterium]